MSFIYPSFLWTMGLIIILILIHLINLRRHRTVYFIRLGIARDIAARMEYKQLSLQEAAQETLNKLTRMEGTGGFVAVDNKGNPIMLFNTGAMFRGYLKGNGEKVVAIF